MLYDVAVIGAGVIGSLISRELSRYDLKVCLIDKESDVAMGTSKANSAIVHAGYDAKPGSLKAKLNVRGNTLMEECTKELSVPFKRIGSLVIAFNDTDMTAVKKLYEKGKENGVPNLELISGEHVLKMQPNINKEVVGALYAPTAAIVCPYELTVAATENAVLNGVDLKLETEVKDIKVESDKSFTILTNNEEIKCKYVINAAGIYADKLSGMLGDTSFEINPRKGEYVLLDKSQGSMIGSVVFQLPSDLGKGILVTPTVDGNLLIGPNAEDIDDKEDISTSDTGLSHVVHGGKKAVPGFNIREVITSFAGLRAKSSKGDFVIEQSSKVEGLINVAGIDSPGLSAAPAIAEYVVSILKSNGINLSANNNFNPLRKPIYKFREMNNEERAKVIKEDSRYGRIICRCETITEGEIVDCIKRPAGAKNLDSVKRRVRAGMGRCQGGFCAPRVVEILSRELGIPIEDVTKMGGDSKLIVGKTK